MNTRATLFLPITLSCALLATAGLGYGQDDDAARPEVEVQPQGRRLSQIMKYKILIQEDEPAGQVVDFVLSEGGCIDYIVAQREDQYYVIPYSAAAVRYDDSVVFIDMAPAQFQEVQFFTGNNWPNFYVPAYQQQVFTTFGVQVGRNGRGTFRRDLDNDNDLDRDRDNPEGRAEDRRGRREENRERLEDRREDRRDKRDRTPADKDDAKTRKPNADRGEPAKPAPKAGNPAPKAEPKTPRTEPKAPNVKPPKTEAAPPKPLPTPSVPKTPAPKTPAVPKEPAPKLP